MARIRLALASTLACVLFAGCGTTHAVRWTYGMTSTFAEPTAFAEDTAWRAWVGAPVIVGGVLWDVTTWPVQAIFGVWPFWGSASLHMRPKEM